MPLSPGLASWLIEQGHDAVHASQSGLERSPDVEVVERARAESRIVITADLDYPRLLALEQSLSPGLILFRGGDFSEAECVTRLGHAFEIIPGVELACSIVVIERERIRRRRLPIMPD